MKPDELNFYIEKIRVWLVRNWKSEDMPHVFWALDVAINARELERDDYINELIDIFCEI